MKNLIPIVIAAVFTLPAEAVVTDLYECTTTLQNQAGEKVAESKSTLAGLRQGMVPFPNWLGDWSATNTKFALKFQYDDAESDQDIELDFEVWYVHGADYNSDRAFTYGCDTHTIIVGNMGLGEECAIASSPTPYDPYELFTKVTSDENGLPRAQAQHITTVNLARDFEHPTLDTLTVGCNHTETVF